VDIETTLPTPLNPNFGRLICEARPPKRVLLCRDLPNRLVYGLMNDIWRKAQRVRQPAKKRIRPLKISWQDVL